MSSTPVVPIENYYRVQIGNPAFQDLPRGNPAFQDLPSGNLAFQDLPTGNPGFQDVLSGIPAFQDLPCVNNDASLPFALQLQCFGRLNLSLWLVRGLCTLSE